MRPTNFFEITEKLSLDVINGSHKELITQIENLSKRFLDKGMAYEYLQDERMHVLNQNKILLEKVSQLGGKK